MWTKLVAAPVAGFLCAITVSRLPVAEAEAEAKQTEKQPRKVSLAGKWRNELGSEMTLDTMEAGGLFRGTYQTSVSAAEKPIRPSPLVGLQNVAAAAKDGGAAQPPTFGFTVAWTFSESTTVFTGQHFVDAKGEETLETVWLLREKEKSPQDDWKATRVGRNVFKRIQ